MAYASSPRPSFDRPTVIPAAAVTRHLWGDAESGLVDDWIFVSSQKIHQLMFGMPPGGAFRHSPEYRTVFGADEVLIVLQGCLGCANPETGELVVAHPGEAVFFRKDTWHHGFSLGTQPLRVLEFFAPPPAAGMSGSYARTRPYLEREAWRFGRDDLLGRWPMARAEVAAQATLHHLSERDLAWRLEGHDQSLLVGLYCATEHLTCGRARLLPGQRSQTLLHGGDKGLYVLSGHLNVLTPDWPERPVWFDVHPGDGFFVPAETAHQFHNGGTEPVELLFGVAPRYGT